MKNYWLVAPALIAVSVAMACSGGGGGGGSSTGSGTVTGNIDGAPFVVRDAVSAVMSLNGGTAQAIILADASNLCAAFTANTQPGNARAIILQAADNASGVLSAPTGAGTYSFFTGAPPNGPLAAFIYRKTDSVCTELISTGASSGSITFTSVGAHAAGSATVLTTLGDSITIDFQAASCPAVAAVLEASAPPPCAQ